MDYKPPRVLIGCDHAGEESAKRVVAEIQKHGLRKGDLVVAEYDPYTLNTTLGFIETGVLDLELPRLQGEIDQLGLKIKNFTDPLTKEQIEYLSNWHEGT